MPTTNPARTQQERSEATIAELLDAARELFAADGYATTSLQDVVSKARVTKGALYHHFSSKSELFRAVFEREQVQLAHAIDLAYQGKRDHWEGVFAGCRAVFEASLDPGVQRIIIFDAPSVLPWEELREIQHRHAVIRIKMGLEVAIKQGYIAKCSTEPLAHLIFGAICEGSTLVARAPDPGAEARTTLRELRSLLDGLLLEPRVTQSRGRKPAHKRARR